MEDEVLFLNLHWASLKYSGDQRLLPILHSSGRWWATSVNCCSPVKVVKQPCWRIPVMFTKEQQCINISGQCAIRRGAFRWMVFACTWDTCPVGIIYLKWVIIELATLFAITCRTRRTVKQKTALQIQSVQYFYIIFDSIKARLITYTCLQGWL